MPDNSGLHVFQRGLSPGRRPALRPTIPYRLEEWGKGRAYYLPEGKDGPRIPKRGPPPSGPFALYIGAETSLPRKGRTVEEGFAYSKEDASDHADAYLRRRLMEQIGRARRRAANR